MAKKKREEEDDNPEDTSPSSDLRKRKKGKKDDREVEDIELSPGGEDDHVSQKSTKIAPKCLTTREIGRRYLNRESYLKLCIKEMLIYFIFLIVLGILAAGHHSNAEYYLTRSMTKLFTEAQFRARRTNEAITYKEINTVEHVWSYFHHYLQNTFWIYWYSHQDKVDTVPPEINDAILYENKILGRPRIRQVRVRKDSCSIPDEVKNIFGSCYAEYSSSAEDTGDYGPAETNVSTAWKYQSAGELGSLSVSGQISTYGGGGYYFDFKRDMEKTNSSVMELLRDTWLDRGSRALIMQFTTYSVNENIFFTLILLLEIPPTGGVIPSYTIYIHKFFDRDFWDMLLLICFAVFVLFILWYTIEEVYEISYFRWHYFDSFWNFLDFFILMLAYITIGSYIFQYLVVSSQLPQLIEKVEEFACFDHINSARETLVTLLVILFFFAAIKAAKYLNFNHSMHQMQTTIQRATKDIACFSVIFFIVFITFAQLGHLLFGGQVKDFRSFIHAVFALLRTAVGDFDYQKIERVNHFLGPIYFFAYIFFIYFILVNMFLAIIIDTYSEVRANIRDQSKDLHISDIFGNCLRNMLRICGMKKIADKHEPPSPKLPGEESPYDDIHDLLRRCGFNDMEIDLFFSKFDIPRDKPISQEDMRKKLMQNFNLQSDSGGLLSAVEKEKDELGEKLMQRIRNLEENITDVNYKIDLIDNKIDSIQQIRAKKTLKENLEMAKTKNKDFDEESISSKDTLRKRKNIEKKDQKEDDSVPPSAKSSEYLQHKPVKEAPMIFTTREIGKRYMEREEFLKLCIREMFVYLVFLIVLGFLSAGHHSQHEYYLSRVMTNFLMGTKFKTYLTNEVINYEDVNTLENVWDYFHFYQESTFWTYWYGNLINENTTMRDEDRNMILYENKLIGKPRIRQLRVKNDSCEVPPDFQLMFSHCYAEYSSSSEETADYGPGDSNSSTAWHYHKPSDLKSLQISSGEISTYYGGGYYFDFKNTVEETNKTVMELFHNLWLDRGSRALILQFTTYNVNINLFFTLTLLLELPPTGGVLPSYIIYTHKFISRDLGDMLLMILFLIFVIFMLWYTVEEIYEIIYFKWRYFESIWNILDLVIVVFGYTSIVFFVFQYMVINTQLNSLLAKTDEFACFDEVNAAKETYTTLLSILFFFAGIKVLKYINFNHSMHQMQNTLSRATKDIACFSIIFFIVFITFAQLGHLLFGSQVRDFRSFVHSVFALLRTAVGDFDYHKIENVNHFLGPVYFFAYIFFIYFILVNMFLAIIIDTYSEVRSSIRDQAKELQMGDIFARWFGGLLGLCGMKKIADKHAQPLPIGGEEDSHFHDIQNLLRRCGFNDKEIDLFFSKFDIPKDKAVTQEEMRHKLLQNFNLQSEADRLRGVDQEKDEMGEKLMQRIRLLEDNITDVNYKIDLIDNKIDVIQQIRAMKRTKQSQAGPSTAE
ncbi:uncharacterized protein LOC128995452 [Macrosteles quadrilineatus]|uniref:uncharacterized protein LOC128995452 n=1 Tax=Macrosteles quadrilineatus TaxID=74068 RepID=UPI0023E0AF7C|nr:uncharacterized protein LOC128995452 [Macrosteles quadrilineatus]